LKGRGFQPRRKAFTTMSARLKPRPFKALAADYFSAAAKAGLNFSCFPYA
jgi:hypothetical protein